MSEKSKIGEPKMRILHPRLAAVLANLRHGEMVFVADAGTGTSAKALIPLDPGVEIIDVGVATGVPTFADVVGALCQVGDFEGAIVSEGMKRGNPADHAFLVQIFGEELVHGVPYFPDFYLIRDRVKVLVQTGDFGIGANAMLISGYPSPNIPLNWLKSSDWFEELKASGTKLVNTGAGWAPKTDGPAKADG